MVLDQKIDLEKEIQFASMEDIPKWIELVRLVVDGFPCLDEKQYVEQLKDCIQKKQALILKDKDIAIGIMGITIATGSMIFLGIHPQYRKQGITQAFLKKAISLLITSDEISVTTFREGDKADTGYRNIFKNLGFAEAELLVEFGYPTQRFVLQKKIGRKQLMNNRLDNPLAQDFTIKSLLKFAFPTMLTMVFMGLYTIGDTIFVSRFVNTDALSAINIVTPVINLIVGLGTMLATGGSAIIARKMGEKN